MTSLPTSLSTSLPTSLPTTFPHALTRTVLIRATPETVFRFFTDSARWAAWWGAGSTIDSKVGGAVRICYPGGIVVLGNVMEIVEPKRIVFTYGFESGTPITAGSSRVTIQVAADQAGTLVSLRHEFEEAHALVRDEHVQGWRYQLSVFANVVANEAHANAADIVDEWFAAWAEPDAGVRSETLHRIASPAIQFHDRYSTLDTLPDLLAHITAAQRFMPNVRMKRTGKVRHCQGVVLAEWKVRGEDAKIVMSGTNVFSFDSMGQLRAVTGLVAGA